MEDLLSLGKPVDKEAKLYLSLDNKMFWMQVTLIKLENRTSRQTHLVNTLIEIGILTSNISVQLESLT